MTFLTRPYLYISTQSKRVTKEQVQPAWYGNFDLANSWRDDETVMYYTALTTDTLNDGSNVYSGYVQYGHDYPGWATIKYFVNRAIPIKETRLDNNILQLTVDLYPASFASTRTTQPATGIRVIHELYLGDELLKAYSGLTTDEFVFEGLDFPINSTSPKRLTVNIQPQQYALNTPFTWRTYYPDGQFSNAQIILGVTFFNPLDQLSGTYRPGSIRMGANYPFLSLDNEGGFIKKRVGSTTDNWNNVPLEDRGTILHTNKGHNQIRMAINGRWAQLPPGGGNQ